MFRHPSRAARLAVPAASLSRHDRGESRPAPLALAVHLALAAGMLAAAGWQADAHAQAVAPAASVRSYDIPAGRLGGVLAHFAGESGILLAGSSDLVRGRNSPGVRGTLSTRAALDALLAGTGLEAFRQADGSYGLRPAPVADKRGEVTMAPVTVTAEPERSGLTEGSGSYAANAATIGKGGARSLREIPQSISVITNQQIADQALHSVEEALIQAPGLYADGIGSVNGGEYSSIYKSRGFDMAYSVDGIASTNTAIQNASQLGDLGIVDRVEVLRGPAALLRGSETGNFGGAVNVVRKRPLPEFGVSTILSAGSWDDYRGMVDVTGALNEQGSVRGRAVLSASDRDFFHGPTSHDRSWTGYGIVEIDLTPRTTWTLSADRTESRTDQPYTGVPRYAVDRVLTTDRSFNQNREQAYSNVDSSTVSTELVHRFDNEWRVQGRISYQEYHRESDGFYALGATFVNPATNIVPSFYRLRHDMNSETWSYDLNVSGPFELLGRQHRWTMGMDGSRYRYQLGAVSRIYTDTVDAFDTGRSFPDVAANANPFDRIYPQHAFYGVGQFKLADPLTLILGARVSDFEYRNRTIGRTDWVTSLKETGEVTPYGGVIWDVTRQISLYASYADLFVPQSQVTFAGETLPPRVGWQGEVGAKGEFFDGRLNASLALYRMRDSNRAIVDPDPAHVGCGTSPTATCYLASGLVQSQGVDMEISGNPWRGLQLVAGYTYNENEYLRDSNAANIGQRFDTRTPRHLFKLWSSYRFRADDFDGVLTGWRVGAGVVAQSDTYYISGGASSGGPRYVNPGRAIANAMIGWQVTPKTALDLNINNLFDKRYFTSAMLNYNAYGAPRSVALTLRHQF